MVGGSTGDNGGGMCVCVCVRGGGDLKLHGPHTDNPGYLPDCFFSIV